MVLISNIVNLEDRRFQVRPCLNRQTLKRYKQAMKAAAGYGEFPPVKLAKCRGDLYLFDGWHRKEAAKWAGIMLIPAEIVPVNSKEEIASLAGKAKLKNPLQLGDKTRRIVFRAYMENQEYLKKRGKAKSLNEMCLDLDRVIPRSTLSRWIKQDF